MSTHANPPRQRTLRDWDGAEIRERMLVQIRHPRHLAVGETGLIARIELGQRRVWVRLDDGRTVPAGCRSVKVIL